MTACNPSTLEVETGKLEVQAYLKLYCKSEFMGHRILSRRLKNTFSSKLCFFVQVDGTFLSKTLLKHTIMHFAVNLKIDRIHDSKGNQEGREDRPNTVTITIPKAALDVPLEGFTYLLVFFFSSLVFSCQRACSFMHFFICLA